MPQRNRPCEKKGRLRAELGHGGVERSCDQLIQRAFAQFFVEDFYANRAAVAGLPDVIEKSRNIEFAFATQHPVIDRVFVEVPGRGECAIVDFDAEEILQRKAGDLLVRDAELHDVPEVENDAAVFRAGALEHRQSVLERVNHGEGHEFVDNFCAVGGSILAKSGEGLDHLRQGSVRVEEITNFNVSRAQNVCSRQQVILHDIGPLLFFTGEKPVAEKFKLDVFHAVVIEDALDFR